MKWTTTEIVQKAISEWQEFKLFKEQEATKKINRSNGRERQEDREEAVPEELKINLAFDT